MGWSSVGSPSGATLCHWPTARRCISCLTVCYRQSRSAGLLTADEIDKLMAILSNPLQFKIPEWFLNRRRDIRDGKTSQITSNDLLSKLRDDIEGLKKIRCVRRCGAFLRRWFSSV